MFGIDWDGDGDVDMIDDAITMEIFNSDDDDEDEFDDDEFDDDDDDDFDDELD